MLYAPYLRERYPNSKFEQLIGKNPSSGVLAFNLMAAGFIRPENSAAHHIVAQNDPRAQEARDILKRENIDINEALNGVFLPANSKYENLPAMTHSTLHTTKYYDEVSRRLSKAAPGKVGEALQQIRKELLNGTFPN